MLSPHLEYLIAHQGYLAVFGIVFLESAGLPVPGETVLIVASGYAGMTGRLDIAFVIVSAVSGAILGDNTGFWIGRHWGAALLSRYGKYIRLNEKRLQLGQYLFERHGGKIVFFGRFVAFLRVLAAVLAGVNNYRWGPFLFYNSAGAICWALIMGFGSYKFGDSIQKVSGPLGVIALLLFLGAIFGFIYFVHIQEKKMHAHIASSREREISDFPNG